MNYFCVLLLPLLINAPKQSDLAELRHLKEVLWPKAYREQDTVLLDRILAREFQLIDASGNWTTKADELAYIKEHKTAPDSFRYDIKRLEIFDDHTAIIAGTGIIINYKNGKPEKTIYQSSNILIRRKGSWKAISSHVSGIKRVE